MTFDWNYQEMGVKELYQLHFQTKSQIMAAGRPKNGEEVRQALGRQAREAYQIGDWLVESIQRPYGLEVLLRRAGDGVLELAVRNGNAVLNARLLRKPMEERTYNQATLVTVSKQKIQVIADKAVEKRPDPAPKPEAKPRPRPEAPDFSGEAAALLSDPNTRKQLQKKIAENRALYSEEELAVLDRLANGLKAEGTVSKEVLETLKSLIGKPGRRPHPELDAELQALRKKVQAMEQTADQARAQLEEERQRNADLQIAASAHLSELLTALEPQRERLAATLQGQLDKAAEAQKSLKFLEDQTGEARQKLEETERKLTEKQAELDRLRSMETLRNLDCGVLEKEQSCLREQLEADGLSAALLDEEAFFDSQKLNERMEAARKSLEELEEQLAQAVRQRERIDGMIQDATLKENGMISLDMELGGKADGHGGAEEKNS